MIDRDMNPPDGIETTQGIDAYYLLPPELTHPAIEAKLTDIYGINAERKYTYLEELIETWEIGGDLNDAMDQLISDAIRDCDRCQARLAFDEVYK